MKIKHFEDMARKMVGDGKDPDLYFVSVDGEISAVTSEEADARAVTDVHGQHVVWVIENRKTGVLDESEASQREQERLAEEEETVGGSPVPAGSVGVPVELLEKVNRYRDSVGRTEIRPGEWTREDLEEYLSHAPERYHNPAHAALKRKLMQ